MIKSLLVMMIVLASFGGQAEETQVTKKLSCLMEGSIQEVTLQFVEHFVIIEAPQWGMNWSQGMQDGQVYEFEQSRIGGRVTFSFDPYADETIWKLKRLFAPNDLPNQLIVEAQGVCQTLEEEI